MKVRKGFTLVELLAVIAILAILVVIAIPNVMKMFNNAKKETFLTEVKKVYSMSEEKYISSSLNGNQLRIISSEDDSKLKLEGKKLKYCITLDSRGKVETLKVSDGQYVVSLTEGQKVTDLKKEDLKEGNLESYECTIANISNKLKDKIEGDTAHIKKGVVVNGKTVNKVVGTKSEKDNKMKNYVWYSGNLWQVIETSSSSIKMVLAHSITSIPYGNTSDWNTSWVRKWLNEIDRSSTYDGVFYNGLENKNIIVNGDFCLDEVNVTTEVKVNESNDYVVTIPTSATKITNCQNRANDKVGILTFEDYVYANNGTTAVLSGGSFLDEDELMWTMTKYTKNASYKDTLVWTQWYNNIDNKSGTLAVNTGETVGSVTKGSTFRTNTYGHGVRAVINIRTDVSVSSGSGTKKDPYILSVNKTVAKNAKVNTATIGEYIYLSEENAPSGSHSNRIVNGYTTSYDKNKVAYRIVDINSDGSIKVQRADILRGLDSNISIRDGVYVPFYYVGETNSSTGCALINDTWYVGGCKTHNYFKPDEGNEAFNYNNSMNVAYYLNNATNSYYSWLSTKTKNMIQATNWDLAVTPHGSDYSAKYTYTTSGTYPSRKSDGKVTANIGLPSYGDRYSGNDLNFSYWYINRLSASSSRVGLVASGGDAYGNYAGNHWDALRPEFTLKSDILVESGKGTMSNPYTIK